MAPWRTSSLARRKSSPASPILANICLHVLLDQWFQQHWADKGEFVRYADDAIFVFSDEETAHSFQLALIERMAEAGLRLDLDKTRIVPFSAAAPKGTITLLGFELYWGIKRGVGKLLKVKTIPRATCPRSAELYDVDRGERQRKTTAVLWREAAAKMIGHFRYYGVLLQRVQARPLLLALRRGVVSLAEPSFTEPLLHLGAVQTATVV